MILRLTALLFAATLATTSEASRERLSLDEGWRFHLGDIPFPVITGQDDTYNNAKAGKAWGAAAPEFDDTAWRELDLPHDWAVEGPFDKNENISQGYRPRGIGWYRRQFRLDPSDRGKHLELQFDGVATHCTVWFNGTVVARNWCGYTSFYIDITPMAQYGDGLNTVVVRVDASVMEGWWYEGAGIYRHTWLVKRDPVHILTDGVYANPVRDAAGKWSVPVEVTVENSGPDAASVEVEASLGDARQRTQVSVAALDQVVAKLSLPVASPKLWSVDSPTLYPVQTVVRRDGKPVDELAMQVGFRTIRFDADKGFFLNDQPMKIHGTCEHQGHAGVGVAVPESLFDFRIRKLKEMGVNAIRSAHNPPNAEFLDACDRLGMMVMDENRNFNSTAEYIRQLEWMVRRDRNHPSVILWSVFNEEPMQGSEQGMEMVRRMNAAVKKLDTTRPVTAAQSGGQLNPVNVSQAVDVVGFNYQIGSYDKFHAANPTKPVTSSEDTSALMTRGEYITDKKRNIVGSYDTENPSWGATHRVAWKAIATRPFLAGAFIWTGFDYRGEPTPYKWPSVGSFFGCMDLCGFPKMAFYLHQAQWIESRPILQLVPHWNWPAGKTVKVMALANCETVALSLNGQPLGEKPVDKFEMVSWDVPYVPGKLEAIGKTAGKEVSRFAVETTGEPVALRLTPDGPTVTVEALDAKGRPVPTANMPVEFELTGPGAILGLGNGDPNCHEPEKGNRHSLFNGLAQVIVQGSGTLRAKSEGMKPAEITIHVSAPVQPAVAQAERLFSLQKWRMSPVTATEPDPNQEIAESDQNFWQQIQPGKLHSFTDGSYAVYRIKFKPFAGVQKHGGQLVFKSITGKARIWLDKTMIGRKDASGSAPMAVPIPPGEGERMLSVMIEAQAGQPAGFGGAVTVEPNR